MWFFLKSSRFCVTPTDLKLFLHKENLLATVMLDISNVPQHSQASGMSADDLSFLDDFPFFYNPGVLVATTLVEGILSEFPITQDSLNSTCITDATSGLKGSKLVTYTPQIDSDLALDRPQHWDSNVLSKSVEVRTMTEPVQRSKSTQERLKEL